VELRPGSVELAVLVEVVGAAMSRRRDEEGSSDFYAAEVGEEMVVGVTVGIVIAAGFAVGRLAEDAWAAACMIA
jgi:hypothetical protein